MKIVKVSVVGARGYTGKECHRLLRQHPGVSIEALVSSSRSGEPVSDSFAFTGHQGPAVYSQDITGNEDFIFLCLPHGAARAWLINHTLSEKTRVIDLSQDHRYQDGDFCYGLPELNAALVSEARYVANPGCFATAIQLSLLPFEGNDFKNTDIHVHAMTGSTGAGQELSRTSHFTERQNNVSAYKVFNHQHLFEIEKTLERKHQVQKPAIFMTPLRGPFTRGIFCTTEFSTDRGEEEIKELFASYYKKHPFVSLCDRDPSIKDVLLTNHCLISVKKFKNYVQIISVIDNLMKGAAGQAVQNMNLMAEFSQSCGLEFSPVIH